MFLPDRFCSRRKILLSGIAGALLSAAALQPAAAQTNVAYNWRSVVINGGGFAMETHIHPSNSNVMFVRSDMGLFRWDAANSQWVGALDKFTKDDVYSTPGFALDPGNSNVVYAALGIGTRSSQEDIYKSTDGGVSWVQCNVNLSNGSRIYLAGNSSGRWLGPRLVVDPNNSSVVYYGSQGEGVFKTTSAGSPGSWSLVSSFSARGATNFGASSVAFDKTGGTISVGGQTVTKIIYVAVHGNSSGNTDEGVYRSTDGGQSWVKLGGLTNSPNRLDVGLGTGATGRVWVSSKGGLWFADRTASTLTKVSSPTGDINGVVVDPRNSSHVVASGDWNLVRSTNADSATPTFSSIYGTATQAGDAPWRKGRFGNGWGGVTFDPNSSGGGAYNKKVWFCDWYQPWRSNDITVASPVWQSVSKGYETVVNHGLSCPPSGAPLFSYHADVGGFRHSDLTTFPNYTMFGNSSGVTDWGMGDGSGLDFCETDTNFIAHVGGHSWGSFGGGGLSTDNGVTFTPLGTGGAQLGGLIYNTRSTAYKVGKVAVGATKQSNGKPVIVYAPGNTAPLYSKDWGVTWNTVSGITTGIGGDYKSVAEPLAADRVNGNKFYAVAGGWGYGNDFYRSTDGGVTWTKTMTWSDTGAHDTWTRSVKAQPGTEGAVWASFFDPHNPAWGARFVRSADSGTSFVNVANVTQCHAFSFGKAAPGYSTPALYVLGNVTVGGVSSFGIFRSDNATSLTGNASGATWVRVYDQSTYATGVNKNKWLTLQADRQTYGRVYVGTSGRGVWVGDPAGSSGGATNLVSNPGFEAEQFATQTPSGWSETQYDWNWNTVTADAAFTESGGNSGSFRGAHYKTSAYRVFTYQVKTGLANGLYTLRCKAKSSGGQTNNWLEANNHGDGGSKQTAWLPVSSTYQTVQITDINVTNGQCTIGIWSDSPANKWSNFDDFEFFKQ